MDISKIAELAGVSKATVSRYLNDGYVSQANRQKIAEVIAETGYVPSRTAKTLRTGKTQVIGVIIPKINSASVSEMVSGMSQFLNSRGYQMLLANVANDEKKELDFLELFTRAGNVDGVVLIGTVLTAQHRKLLHELTIPVVVLNQSAAGVTSIFQPDYQAMFKLAKKVLKKAQKAAYIGVLSEDISAGKMRTKAFCDAYQECGLGGNPPTYVAGFNEESGYRLAGEILADIPRVDTIMCASDHIALGVIAKLVEQGLKVPEQVQVTGVGNAKISPYVVPPLTTIHYSYFQSAGLAAERLLELIKDRQRAVEHLEMDYQIIERLSTR